MLADLPRVLSQLVAFHRRLGEAMRPAVELLDSAEWKDPRLPPRPELAPVTVEGGIHGPRELAPPQAGWRMFARWLRVCRRRGELHGSILAYAVGERMWDAGVTADAWLLWAEASELISRGAWRPTLEQEFFGWGGFLGNRSRDPQMQGPREHVWTPGAKAPPWEEA
jgi:hypothetical protein